ncbi:MAG: ribonuclease J [Roseovarius sp.]
MSEERVIFLPLGGAGEIGMNAYVFGVGKPGRERLILVDLGVSFPDMDGTPGVELIFPDIAWLAERRARLEAVFITHAHEDHIGALAHLYERLGAPPVYARAFTAHIVRAKLAEAGLPTDAVTTVSAWPEQVAAGPFRVGFVPISHSIPESSGLVIDTPLGRVVHSGDFKMDTGPVVGEAFDEALWASLAAPGVLALCCDSTNVFTDHPGRSESSLGPGIEALIAGAGGMFVATTFASNIARVKTMAEAAIRTGRAVCLLGRAMQRMIGAAQETGVLGDFPATISPEEARNLPRDKVMLIVTGSQGERRAASAQLAQGRYNGLELKPGDTFLFSSKTIPGNERAVIRIMNQMSELGVDVIDESSGRYHVSGHANRPDLERLHRLIAPRAVVPIHGEHRHLREHVKLARAAGYEAALAANGSMVALSEPGVPVVERIEAGRIYLDGQVQVGALDGVVRDRIRMALNGHVLISVIIDEDGLPLGEPWCELSGLPEQGISRAPLADLLEHDLDQFMGRAGKGTLADDDKLEEGLRKVARQSALQEIGKRPEVTVIISRLSS